MPSNLSITSYGHCYHALIVANLIKSGISHSDKDINVCFNVTENWASEVYQLNEKRIVESLNFDRFVNEYRHNFIISDSIVNRLKDPNYGILTPEGDFRLRYMYYFFLGSFLSKNRDKHGDVIEHMCDNSHVTSNHMTVLFVIHHTNDDQIIDDILLRTMCTFDHIQPAVLNHEETKQFGSILTQIHGNILSGNSVEHVREQERITRDTSDEFVETEDDEEMKEDKDNPVNDLYRILKNNEILGQILRNNYGKLERTKIEEIVETIADGGLRLVSFLLKDENGIAEMAAFIKSKYPNYKIAKIQATLSLVLFLWTMINVEKVVSAVNVPEIRREINNIVAQKSTPAYDLVGYFNRLDGTEELTKEIKEELERLLKQHDDLFIKRVLSLRTQHYINTHRSRTTIEQSVCSLLGLKMPHTFRSVRRKNQGRE